MSTYNRVLVRWGAWCAILAGIGWVAPVFFYFYLLPAAGSSSTHAQDPASFLPWMIEHGGLRVALWWTTSIPLLIALFGIPLALRERLRGYSPCASIVSALSGVFGLFTLLLAALMLAVGELPLARAYLEAGAEGRTAIVAAYEWQRLVTAILFDALGLFLVGAWILVSSLAGLRRGGLPKGCAWFGAITGIIAIAFVTGYVTGIGWLGEGGIGMAAFAAIPMWMIWLGIALLRGMARERQNHPRC